MAASKQTVAQPAAAKQESAGRTAPALQPLALMATQLGNSAMRFWLQAKLKVSAPQDLYEQEADRVADQVMRQAPVQIQRACSKCEEEDKLHRSAEAADGTPVVTAATENAIAGLSGRGQQLPEDIRSFMEPRFGADFTGVRIHTDAHAGELARSVDAQAFTVGSNVVFGAGHYAPQTDRGKRLLAHELTHVIQQQGGQRAVQRRPQSGEGDMARQRERARAREDFESQGGQLKHLERCILHCHFSSTEARRWYTQHFLELFYRKQGPGLSEDQLHHLMLQYEAQFQRTQGPQDVAMIPVTAGSMAWLDTAMQPKPDFKEVAAQYAEHERWVNSKEYRILQRPLDHRFYQALSEMRRDLGKEMGGNYADGNAHETLIMEPKVLWEYGVAHDLFAPREQPDVFGRLAKEVARTYSMRYRAAVMRAKLVGDIVRHPSADDVLHVGLQNNFFLSEEKEQVLKDRFTNLKEMEAERSERSKQLRRKYEIDRYRAWVAQGDRLRSPEPFIQPFAFGAFGWFVAAAYGGTSTGMLGAETYKACVQGQGNCADAVFTVGVGAATHVGTRGMMPPNEPRVPAPTPAPRAVPAAPPVRAPVAAPPKPRVSTVPVKTAPKETPAPVRATETPAPNKDFDTEGPTHPDLFPENEKTFEMDPPPGSHVDDPAHINIEELPLIEHPPDVPPGTRPTQKPDLPPDTTPLHEPVEIEIPDSDARASATRSSSRGRARVPKVVDKRPMAVDGFGRSGTPPKAKAQGTFQVGVPGRPRKTVPFTRSQSHKVGEFAVLGERRVQAKIGVRPDPGKVLHWRIRTIVRNRRVLTDGDVGPLLETLLADARGAGAVQLRISGKLHKNQDFNTLQKLARLLGGDARKLDAENIEMEIPVASAPPQSAPPTPTPAATPGRPVQQRMQQQQTRVSREDPTPPDRPRSPERGGDPPRMRAIVYVSPEEGNLRRAIVVVGKTPHYQASGTSPSHVVGQPTYKAAGRWYEFAGIQEWATEVPGALEQGVGHRGWIIKAEGMTHLEANPRLDRVRVDIEFETTSPERINDWLYEQGADSFRAIEHNGLLDPIPDVEPMFDGDTQP